MRRRGASADFSIITLASRDVATPSGRNSSPGTSTKLMQKRFDQAEPVISISNLSKTYASGFQALKRIDLDIRRGEIFALLGPNGAGKTTLINVICGIVTASEGSVTVD